MGHKAAGENATKATLCCGVKIGHGLLRTVKYTGKNTQKIKIQKKSTTDVEI